MNENDPSNNEPLHARFPVPPDVTSPEEYPAAFEAILVEANEPRRRPRRRWALPLALFVATCLSTYFGYAFYNDWVFRGILNHGFDEALAVIAAHWYVPKAAIYSLCVMTILGCHEMGHFLQARRHGVRTSLPIFLPMPFTPIGTLGAVIAMDSRVADRRALFDIGVTGPLAGLVPTLAFCVLGLQFGWSQLAPLPPVTLEPGDPYVFGEPLLFQWLTWLVFGPRPEGFDVIVGPMAFAGWVGLLITALNLIPIGQLDGGHILYALFRRRAHVIASTLLVAAVAATIFFGLFGWWLMLLLLILMGPKHPPTTDDSVALGKTRIVLGWAMLAFLPLGFTPNPFPGIEGREQGEAFQQEEAEPLPRRPLLPPSPDDRWVRQKCELDWEYASMRRHELNLSVAAVVSNATITGTPKHAAWTKPAVLQLPRTEKRISSISRPRRPDLLFRVPALENRNRSRGLSQFSRRSPRKWDCPPWAGNGYAHFSARNDPKNEALSSP